MKSPLIKSSNIDMDTAKIAFQKKRNDNKEEKVLRTLRTLCVVIAHLIAIIFPIAITVLAKPGSSLFSWHPTLMSFAFGLFMLEAILIFSPDGSLLIAASRKTKVTIHWILQTCGVLCALGGLFCIMYNKYLNFKSHFVSWHGIIGFITTVYVVVQASCGIFLLYPKYAKNWKLVQLKTYHATFGFFGFTLACVTISLSFYSNWYTRQVGTFVWYTSFICPFWLALVVMNQVTNAYLPRNRRQPL